MTKKKILITGEMLIGDVLNRLPEAAEIMQDYGLHCISCSVNVFEPLKMGALGHGIPEETADEMIEKINDLALVLRRAPDDGIYVTEKAALKIQEFAKAEEKSGWGLKITATPQRSGGVGKEPAYAMDFQEKKIRGDTDFEFHEVHIFLDKASLKSMLGSEVDYIESEYGSGFKITNPNFTGQDSCCGGGGGNGSACGCS